jgi:class 3 adenylate cyclase/tetratricopeptide (TPR) repeat protein
VLVRWRVLGLGPTVPSGGRTHAGGLGLRSHPLTTIDDSAWAEVWWLMDQSELPEGPVTLLFTDIEGSTALRTSLGDAKADVLFREHDDLIRGQIEENKGWDQKAALGDGFLAVFASTRRALACAIGIQRALDSFNLERGGTPLRVRVGLNTGEVAWHGGQLAGEVVHAAARVCAAASGGQILVSDVTRQLAGTVPDVTFHDRGEHQLKGFPEPWRLWEVVWVRETTQVPRQVFVGRDEEMATLRSRLDSALDNRGGLLLLGGEPGVGKTTLVRQLIREAEQRGALAVFGRCYESEGAVPYSPFVEMLEQALAIIPPDIIREDLGDDAAEVARMVPELRRRFPDIGPPLDLPPEQQRRYFFNAVGSFIARGSKRFPLMLVMDDVHWADEPSLLLIEHMAALVPELRVLAVGTYRDVELDVARPLAATLERLVRSRTVERLPIKRFSQRAVGAMLEALAGKRAPSSIVRAVFEETEGNPFFVEEVFWHLVEEGKVLDDGGDFRADVDIDELDVPESVRLVVGRRLERLGADAQSVLAAGAVVGRGFPFTLLEAITDVDSSRLLDIVDEAEAAKVVVSEQRDREVYYSFAHELIRQTLLSGLSLLRRQRLHLAIAEAIERTDKSAARTRPSEIAHHLLEAGAGAETERTLGYLERAAERAAEAAAFEDALRAIDDALALVDQEDKARFGMLLERKGWTLRALGQFEECLTIWDEVLPIYGAVDKSETAANLCFEIGYMYIWLSRFAEAFASYERGLELLGGRRSPVRARLMGAAGTLTGLAGLFEQAEQRFEEALRIARELDDDRALGSIEWGRSLSNWSNARPTAAIESGLAAVDHLRQAQDLWGLVDALAWTSYPLDLTGDHQAGRRLAEEGVELGAKLGHVGGEILARRGVYLASVLERVDLEKFEKAARHDLVSMESIRSPWVSQAHAWIAGILILRGDLEEARRHAEQAMKLEPASAWSGLGWSYKFLSHAWGGDRDTCEMMLSEQRSQFPKAGEETTTGRLCMVNAAAHGSAIIGLAEQANDLYPTVAEHAETMPLAGSIFELALAQRIAGMAAAAGGSRDKARDHFDKAMQQVEELPHPLERPAVQHWYGKMLIEGDKGADHRRGRAMVMDAVAGYKDFGMPLHASTAKELLG